MSPPHSLGLGRKFTIDDDDLDTLMSILLDQESPLTTNTLARALIQTKLDVESTNFEEQYRDAEIYDPARSYDIGQRLMFPAFDHETAIIVDKRAGNNQDLGVFSVIGVEFEQAANNLEVRQFAIELSTPHKLSQTSDNSAPLIEQIAPVTVDDLLTDEFMNDLKQFLQDAPELACVADLWFPRELLLDVNIGHLNLAEAALALTSGEPLDTRHILNDIGGLDEAPPEMQIFSLNYHLKQDNRFDEVGPAGQIYWHLSEAQPKEVKQTPASLRYNPIDYDRGLLTPEMLALEAEIEDEYSDISNSRAKHEDSATVTLIYPHRRMGTFPLNIHTQQIFPDAATASRIWVTLIDNEDGEEFSGWVVPKSRFVFGFDRFFRKHRLPVGAYLRVTRDESAPGRIIVGFDSHRARTEWIRLIVAQDGRLHFESDKRSIGANYDDLMIIGADDLTSIDTYCQSVRNENRTLFALMKELLPELSKLTPQGTVHAKTLYSAVNIFRRCPPGPILAILSANPEFVDMGGQYWKLTN